MKTTLYLLLVFFTVNIAAAQQNTISHWQVHQLDNLYKVAPQLSTEDRPSIFFANTSGKDAPNPAGQALSDKINVLEKAKELIPEQTDPGWRPVGIGIGGTFHHKEESEITGCAEEVDYTFFQTTLHIANMSKVGEVTISYDNPDDAARVYIKNSSSTQWQTDRREDRIKNPCLDGSGTTCHYSGARQVVDKETSHNNLRRLLIEGDNRIVVAHYDQCSPGNLLENIHLKADGVELLPNASLHFSGQKDDKPNPSGDFLQLGTSNPDTKAIEPFSGLDLNGQWMIQGWINPEAPGIVFSIVSEKSGSDEQVEAVKLEINSDGHLQFILRKDLSSTNTVMVTKGTYNGESIIDKGWLWFSVGQSYLPSTGLQMVMRLEAEDLVAYGLRSNPLYSTSKNLDIKKEFDESEYTYYLGRGPKGAKRYYQGRMDDIRIWKGMGPWHHVPSRYTRITSEQTGLVANYNFDDGEPGKNNSTYFELVPNVSLNSTYKNKNNAYPRAFSMMGATSNFAIGAPH